MSLFDNIGVGVTEQKITKWIKKHYSFRCTPDTDLTFEYKDNKTYVNFKGGDVGIRNKRLTSLTNGEFYWGEVKSFNLIDSDITSLEGFPVRCDYIDICGCSDLESLEGCPKYCKKFTCKWCDQVASLKGSPYFCNRYKIFQLPRIDSFEGCPKYCRSFEISYIDYENFKLTHMPKICESIYLGIKNENVNLSNLFNFLKWKFQIYKTKCKYKNLSPSPFSLNVMDEVLLSINISYDNK